MYMLLYIIGANCDELYCNQCFHQVHYGGRRKDHEFRCLFDYYDKRIDYGEGSFPCKWPTEIIQDEIQGWMLRVAPVRQPIITRGVWEEYCCDVNPKFGKKRKPKNVEDSTSMEPTFYFNRETFETTYDPPPEIAHIKQQEQEQLLREEAQQAAAAEAEAQYYYQQQLQNEQQYYHYSTDDPNNNNNNNNNNNSINDLSHISFDNDYSHLNDSQYSGVNTDFSGWYQQQQPQHESNDAIQHEQHQHHPPGAYNHPPPTNTSMNQQLQRHEQQQYQLQHEQVLQQHVIQQMIDSSRSNESAQKSIHQSSSNSSGSNNTTNSQQPWSKQSLDKKR